MSERGTTKDGTDNGTSKQDPHVVPRPSTFSSREELVSIGTCQT